MSYRPGVINVLHVRIAKHLHKTLWIATVTVVTHSLKHGINDSALVRLTKLPVIKMSTWYH